MAAVPFIGLAYIVALPFGFAYALAKAVVEGMVELVGKEAVFGWRPLEAYLAGKKRGERKKAKPKRMRASNNRFTLPLLKTKAKQS